jgi:hypothetical protein
MDRRFAVQSGAVKRPKYSTGQYFPVSTNSPLVAS